MRAARDVEEERVGGVEGAEAPLAGVARTAVALGVAAGGEVERGDAVERGEHAPAARREAQREHLDVAAARLVVPVRRRHVALGGRGRPR